MGRKSKDFVLNAPENKLRKRLKMPLLYDKNRQCLRCDIIFLSESSNNRVCLVCKQTVKGWYVED